MIGKLAIWKTPLRTLKAAVEQEDADRFEVALSDLWRSNFRGAQHDDLCALLCNVVLQDWHDRHEDVVVTIQNLRCEGAVAALEQRALTRPKYLDWDDSHALARKCTWALADIGTVDARKALERLTHSKTQIICGFAQRRLDRWHLELARKGRR